MGIPKPVMKIRRRIREPLGAGHLHGRKGGHASEQNKHSVSYGLQRRDPSVRWDREHIDAIARFAEDESSARTPDLGGVTLSAPSPAGPAARRPRRARRDGMGT